MAKKRVNAGFESKAELAIALAEGKHIYYLNGQWIRFVSRSINPFRIGEYPLDASWKYYADVKVEKEVQWYEDIPSKGVICWVWDGSKEKTTLSNITVYCKETAYPFGSIHGAHYKYAEPVKASELLQLDE